MKTVANILMKYIADIRGAVHGIPDNSSAPGNPSGLQNIAFHYPEPSYTIFSSYRKRHNIKMLVTNIETSRFFSLNRPMTTRTTVPVQPSSTMLAV